MRLYTKLLENFISIPKNKLSALKDVMNQKVIEVEQSYKFLGAEGVVTGYVLDKQRHPDSDHLSILKVEVDGTVLQIVCGAQNVMAGQTVLVALVGAVLPGNFTIKESTIRGVKSFGMVCSLEELGIPKEMIIEEFENGIYYFPKKLKTGIPAAKALMMEGEVLFLGLTPNRSDLMSVLGVSYDLSAALNLPLKDLTKEVLEASKKRKSINIKTPLCETYMGTVIEEMENKPSPEWLKSALIASGIRPISVAVDISNYIQILFGTPLHTFDYDKLGSEVTVRLAKSGEEITVLDKENIKLKETDILIASDSEPITLAGIMGGEATKISEDTKTIFLEGAIFNSDAVRKTSKRIGLVTEASSRFEKGVSLRSLMLANEWTKYLFKTLTNAKIGKTVICGNKTPKLKTIKITEDFITKKLGYKVKKDEMERIFTLLGFTVSSDKVLVDDRRPDINAPIDLVEEFSRINGYDKLEATLPLVSTVYRYNKKQTQIRKLEDLLVDLGLSEVISYSLVSKSDNSVNKETASPVKVLKPLSLDHEEMRTGLFKSLFDRCVYNISRQEEDLKFFEISEVYESQKTSLNLGILLTGNKRPLGFRERRKLDFYDLKEIVEKIGVLFGAEFIFKKEQVEKYLHPERSLKIYFRGKPVGVFGEVHPQMLLKDNIKNMLYCELDITELLLAKTKQTFSELPKVLPQTRDISLVVEKKSALAPIIKTIKQNQTVSEVMIVDLFDKLEDKSLRSVTLRLSFVLENLNSALINEEIKKIKKELETKYNVTFR